MNKNACNHCGREMEAYFSECLVQCACGNKYMYRKDAPIVQLEEQTRPKGKVRGSSPLGSKSKKGASMLVKAGYNESNELIVPIPQEILDELKWKCGDEVDINIEDGQIVVAKK